MIRTNHLSNAEKNISGKLFPPFEVGKVIAKSESYAYEILRTDGKTQKINIKHIKGINTQLQDKLSHLFDDPMMNLTSNQ